MQFNFDEEINKSGTHNTKWEFRPEPGQQVAGTLVYNDQSDAKYGAERLLPMWVADMDFESPAAVVDAVVAWARRGVYGYASPRDSYYTAVIDWMQRRYGRRIQKEWITITPGVNTAIHMLVQTFVKPGEKVLVQRPVYYPFMSAIENNGAEVVSNSLVLENGRYQMDFADLALKAADPAVKMLVLSNPHNPVGRVWQPDELKCLGDICLQNNVLVVADEVHCDLLYKGETFTPFASIDETFAQKSVTCLSASKTFNIAGFKTSHIIIPDVQIKVPFEATAARNGLRGVNPLGIVATEAAYTHGELWLTAVMDYIEANYHFLENFIAEKLPMLNVIRPQGTYLAWIDCRGLGLTPEERKAFFVDEVKLLLDEGELFGPEGEGFERFNLACPRHILAQALTRMVTAVADLEAL